MTAGQLGSIGAGQLPLCGDRAVLRTDKINAIRSLFCSAVTSSPILIRLGHCAPLPTLIRNSCLAFRLAVLAITISIPVAHAGEYKVQPQHTIKAPDGSFVIEQRALVEQDEWLWQAWICPVSGGGTSYPLPRWHEAEWCWAGSFSIAPNGEYLLHIQKTGSGANEGAIFAKQRDGKFVPAPNPGPSAPLIERAWSFFRLKFSKDPRLSRGGMNFVSWGQDGDCLEISLHGSDLGGGFAVDDWRLHYNLVSERFFLSRDQIIHNRRAVVAPVRR